MKQPNFFIIGAPKCGTTSMSKWLGEHPQIFMSEPKEPSFFSSDISIHGAIKTLEKYLQLFQNAGDKHLAVGEASVFYLLSQIAVKNILEFNPNARFIVMLRNPADMAPSLHSQLLWSRTELIEDFEAAWQDSYAGKFEYRKLDRRNIDPVLLQYDKVCKLGELVQRLLQTVDAKSVLFIVMDDLISDPLHEYQRVLEFLDVPYDGKSQFSTHNPAKRPRYKLIHNMPVLITEIKRLLGIKRSIANGFFSRLIQEFNKKSSKIQPLRPLRPEFRQELTAFFQEDVKLLSSLLDRDFSHWLR